MPARALIIGIENYPTAASGLLAKELPGTLDAARAFRKWLLEKWDADGLSPEERQVIFCSEPRQDDGRGASAKDIRRALLELKEAGQGATGELFFFFSGHGFAFVEKPGSRADVIISSDFEDARLSGDCCLNLDEIIGWLRDHLGPGRHFYFVDACRNRLNGNQVTVGTLLPSNAQVSAEASTYLLQSTTDGAVAAVGRAFPDALLAGLHGKGKAKMWDPAVADAMVVKYRSLVRYMQGLLASRQRISSRSEETGEEGGDAILASIKPIPNCTCTIDITDATADEVAEISLLRNRTQVNLAQTWTSLPAALQLEPDDYTVMVKLKRGEVFPAAQVAVDLYEDRVVSFEKVFNRGQPDIASQIQSVEEIAAQARAIVEMSVPSGTRCTLLHHASRDVHLFEQSARRMLAPGAYTAKWFDASGAPIAHGELRLEPGGTESIDLANWRESPPHRAISGKLPLVDGLPDFSERLGGAVADPDLNLWLALLGGGRILGSQGEYSKLARFPLHDFSDEPPGVSPVYVLAGLENTEANLAVALSFGVAVDWREADEPTAMPGIREAYLKAVPGQQMLSFQIDGQVPYTVATLAMRNRATLVTLTLDADGHPQLGQYLLPLGHLLDWLPREVRETLVGRNQLKDVRFLAQASRAYRRRHSLVKEVPSRALRELLAAKWLDPIASTLAAYELVRRGRMEDLPGVIANLQRFFPDLPDTAALRRLGGDPSSTARGVPLFLDGLKVFPDYQKDLPLPASHLDFNSPWTAWRAAVR